MDDFLLLEKVANNSKGAKEAFEQLYDKYDKLVRYRISFYIYDKAYISDLSQEVWEKIFKNASQYKKDKKNDGCAKAWVCQIAKYRCIDYLRRKKEGFFGSDDLVEIVDEVNKDQDNSSGSVTELETMNFEKSIEVDDCVTKGTDKFSIRFPACYRLIKIIAFDNLTIKELAELLGKKEGATRQQVSYCKKNFWKFIEHCLESA